MMRRDQNACANRSERIAALNDALRQGRGSGSVVVTNGILALGNRALLTIMTQIATFDAFSDGNDPYGEHDFGALEHACNRVFWKIDYYSPDMDAGSADPADPAVTKRVLTIMLAEEY